MCRSLGLYRSNHYTLCPGLDRERNAEFFNLESVLTKFSLFENFKSNFPTFTTIYEINFWNKNCT